MRSGTNLAAVGGYNQVVVLNAIRLAPNGISRVEIAERVGLSGQTVSNVCRRLLDDGMVHETGIRISGVGKPRRMLALKADGRFAVGVHIDPSVVMVVLLDLAGSVVAHESIPMPPSPQVEQTIERIVTAVEALVVTARIDSSRIMGVGIAAPGPIDLATGTVINPPLLVGWDRVAVRDILAARLRIPVLLEKDVTAAVVAETWAGSSNDSFVFFYYGTGVGMGVAFDNEVVRGSSGNAGEVGGLVLGGPPNRLAGRLRLGPAILPLHIVTRAIEHAVLDKALAPTEFTGIQGAFETFARRARNGDPAALVIVDSLAEDIATALVSVIDLLDVDRVVFGGPFWDPIAPLLLERVSRLVSQSVHLVVPHPVAFDEATVGQNVVAIGAACLVLDHLLSPRPAALLLTPREPETSSEKPDRAST